MYSVYALGDPRTGEVRYVGATSDVNRRYQDHMTKPERSNQMKQLWIDELRMIDQSPVLYVLDENLEKLVALAKEKYWIQMYLESGAHLTNIRDADLMPPECKVPNPLLGETAG